MSKNMLKIGSPDEKQNRTNIETRIAYHLIKKSKDSKVLFFM
jgi:hypothetical protein